MYETSKISDKADAPANPVSVHTLNEGGLWKRGGMTVIDLAPGAEYQYRGASPVLAHVIEGAVNGLCPDAYVALEPVVATFLNGGAVPARIMIMELFGGKLIPGVNDVRATPIEQRPLGITLKSLALHVIEKPEVGYEYVDLAPGYTVPRHIHHASNAIVLVLEGSGYAGRMIDGVDVVEEIGPGSVVLFPAGCEHGFHSVNGLVIVSGQDPDIGYDYAAVTDRHFKYP